MQCLVLEMAFALPLWKAGDGNLGQLINILTKDIDVFVNSSWAYPYLFTVPLNTVISACFLYGEFGAASLVCYLGMILLLLW